jgi:hypothetical protein
MDISKYAFEPFGCIDVFEEGEGGSWVRWEERNIIHLRF